MTMLDLDYRRRVIALKKQKNAVILAHNYMTPEIFHCVADFTGDGLPDFICVGRDRRPSRSRHGGGDGRGGAVVAA